MEKNTTNILVPTDFTIIAESAVAHAATIATKTNDTIWLLHVITKETQTDLKKQNAGVEILDEKLTKLCAEYKSKYNLTFNYKLKVGSIFTTIGEVATEVSANLIVLGTHGVQGVQHIVGAYALKVVGSSKVPVVVVQQKLPKDNNYLKIVSPIDISVETKQKTLQTISMAKTFGAKVFLYKQKGYDDYFNDLINLNLNFVLRYLNEHNIDSEVVEQEKVSKNFAADFVSYAHKIDSDLIIILTTADKGLKDFIAGPIEQEVINNKHQIPVMCVNPLQNLFKTERLASMVNLSF